MTLPAVTNDILNHPFVLSTGGMIFWFTLKFVITRKKDESVKGLRDFHKKFLDEILLAAIGSLMFIVFDDEILTLLEHYTEWSLPEKVHSSLYLLSPILADRVAKMLL